jgi:hypothetical protein
MQLCTESSKPCTRSLFETTESFIKSAYEVWSLRVFKTWGLLHIELLFQIAMEKNAFLTSSCCKLQPREKTTVRTSLIVDALTTGLKVFS